MPINYQEEGRYDAERGWPSTPPLSAGLDNWNKYAAGYEEGRKKPLPGVKKQYTAQEKKAFNDKMFRIQLIFVTFIILLALVFIKIVTSF